MVIFFYVKNVNYILRLYFYVIVFIKVKLLHSTYIHSILSSSVVERSTVNRLVVGSSPTWGDLNLVLN